MDAKPYYSVPAFNVLVYHLPSSGSTQVIEGNKVEKCEILETLAWKEKYQVGYLTGTFWGFT